MADRPSHGSVALRVQATALGMVRGADLGGAVALEVGETGVLLLPDNDRGPRRAFTLSYDSIEGVGASGETLTIFVSGGDVLELSGTTRLAAAGREMIRHACALPELTLPLRGLGSHRAQPGADHDGFFRALLVARREAERSGDPTRRLAAFDGAALREAMRRVLSDFATARHPRRAPERRALLAALEDAAGGLFDALEEVSARAEAFRAAGDDSRLARWREWTAAILRTFDAADRCWLVAVPVLARSPVRPRSSWRRLLRLGAATLLTLPGTVAAQQVTVEVTGMRGRALLAQGFDVVGSHRGLATVVVDSAARARLIAMGLGVRDMRSAFADQARRLPGASVVSTTVYRPFDDPVRGVRRWIDSLVAANPLVHADSLGATSEGRPVLAVKVGAADDSPSRPNVIFMATYHAREWAATEMALRLIRYLSAQPAPSARVASLVASRDVWIVPVVNPDGYQYSFTTSRLWRKNRRPNSDGTFGVDLNRNHAARWGFDDAGSSPVPASEIYRGPSAASELETQAVERLHAIHPPVTSVSYHTYTGLVLFPPGFAFGVLPGDLGIFRALAGTDERPSVRDNLPSPGRVYYRPAPSWNLYPTNGEYNDWAYARYGTISFTPELTSGFENDRYYGFEFPDDEARLETVFQDNLPFALDVLESAGDPLAFGSANTGLRSERIAIESVSPTVRARVPAASPAPVLTVGGPVVYGYDTLGAGRYTRRIVSLPVARPASITITAGGESADFAVLLVGGAEAGDTGWTLDGFAASGDFTVTGEKSWSATNGTLRSPIVRMPDDADTLSVVYWTRYDGDGFSMEPHGELRVSRDSGRTFTREGRMSGAAPAFYTEQATMTQVAGRFVQLEFDSRGLPWWVDEIALVAHSAVTVTSGRTVALTPSENPVRGDVVRLAWPFAGAGDVQVFDFAGRLIWRERVDAGARFAQWNVAASDSRNGVYIAVARAGRETRRVKLFVLRGGAR